MKVTIKSVIKTSLSQFECFDDQQILFRAGNTLCIKEVNRSDSEFICLNKNADKVYCFKAMVNRKGVFVVEKTGKQIELVMYGLNGERKGILLPLEAGFMAQLEKMQLLVDEYDNYLLYGVAKGRESSCVFLADFSKSKILAMGYTSPFEDVKIDGRQNMTLSVVGNTSSPYIRCLQYAGGKWEISEQSLRKVQGPIIQHELLLGGRKLIVSRNCIYILEDFELSRIIDLSSEGGQIMEVLKIPRGILVWFSNNTLKAMADDSEEISFVMVGQVQLALNQGHRVEQICMSANNEEVWVRTNKNDLFMWRCDNVGTDLDASDLVFTKVDSIESRDSEGVLSLSTQKKYALLAGTNSVLLYNVDKGESMLSSHYSDPIDPSKRAVFSGAINPDGASIMLAFEDKVKIYKILFTKFKYYAEFSLKRVQSIIYSHGGQLVACRYGRGQNACVAVYNLLRLVEVGTYKIQGQPLQVFWNQLDDQLFVITIDSIQIFKVSTNTKVHVKIEEQIRYARLDHRTRKLLVSTKKDIAVVEDGKVVDTMPHPLPDFDYIFPLYGGYFVTNTKGVLSWSASLRFDRVSQYPLFSKQPFKLQCRGGHLLAYTSFQDIMALKITRQNESKRHKFGQDLVVIEKDQILSFFDKVKQIESRFDILISSHTVKMQEEKNNYQQAILKLKSKYQHQIQFTHEKYHTMATSKMKQEKQTEDMFKQLQFGQNKNIDTIEDMYERKCKMEREKVMSLQQQKLAQKMQYQDLIIQLQTKYHREVQAIRQDYANKLQLENAKMDKMKEAHLQDKKRIQLQLLDLEQENQYTLRQLQIAKDAVIGTLKEGKKQLEECNQQVQVKLEAQGQQFKELNQKAGISVREVDRLRQKVKQAENRVALLEAELKRKQGMVGERDQIIKEQAHQIADLEKAKYVLSFRTTQIRKQLQPKENMIDKLKSQMLKLDEQYKELKKKNYNLEQRAQKSQTISAITKRQNSDLRIQLKYKQRTHDQLCAQIFMVVNTVDPKDWNSQIVKIYKNYIKQDKHKNQQKKKKDDTSQEITRHLAHVQQSLMQVTSGTDRIMKGKDNEVIRKMKENSELVYELNVMRKKENQHQKEKNLLVNENARLKRELSQSNRTTMRSQTANSGLSRRFVVSRELYTREKDKHATLDVSDLSSKKDTRDIRRDKTRLTSARRTLKMQDDIKQKSGKFFDIAKELQLTRRELEYSKKTINLQQSQIQQLNQRLFIG